MTLTKKNTNIVLGFRNILYAVIIVSEDQSSSLPPEFC